MGQSLSLSPVKLWIKDRKSTLYTAKLAAELSHSGALR